MIICTVDAGSKYLHKNQADLLGYLLNTINLAEVFFIIINSSAPRERFRPGK